VNEPRPTANAQHPAHNQQSPWRWWVCGVLLLATFLNYMDRQALSVTLPELKREFNLREERIGLVEGCFGYAFAAGAIMFGFLADRFGPRRLYPVVLIGWSIAGFATGFAGHPDAIRWLEQPGDEPGAGTFRWLLFWRTVLGIFEAGHWPCALITARQIFSKKDRTLANGVLQGGAAFASILIPLYAQFIEHIGGSWQITFWSIGVVGLLWVPVWLTLVRPGDLNDPPATGNELGSPVIAPEPANPTGLARRLVVLTLIVGSLNVSWQFLRAWMTLLLDFNGYDKLQARFATTGFFIAAEVGCLLVGVVVMALVKRGRTVHGARMIAFAGFTALTTMAAVVPFVGSGPLMIAGLMIAGAGLLGLHPLYYAFGQELPHRRMGVLAGSLSASGWIISGTFQMFIGARIQATNSYDVGLLIAGLAPVLGLFALLLLWRKQ